MKSGEKRTFKAADSRTLGVKTFAAICAVEGLVLSEESRRRIDRLLASDLSPRARRAEIVQAYKSAASSED